MFIRTIRTITLGTALVSGVTLGVGLSLAAAEHADHAHGSMPPAKSDVIKGYPYSLGTDAVTGEKLPENPVVYEHQGRELRFANAQNVETFKADPAKYLAKVDQQMIRQQMPTYPLTTCMISGDKLGGDMGKPVDLIYKNRLVRFCCPDCVKDFQKDPAKYLKILDDAAKKKDGNGAEHSDHGGHSH